MTNATIKTVYDGIEIEYLENENQWLFELRGRERKVESLEAAKAAIDRPEREKKPAFERINAFKSNGWGMDKFLDVVITSVAAKGRYVTGQQVWCSYNGKREKVSVMDVYPSSESNLALRAEIEGINKQIEALEKQKREMFLKLVAIEVRPEAD